MQLKEGRWRSEDCFLRKPYVCAVDPNAPGSGNSSTIAPPHTSRTTLVPHRTTKLTEATSARTHPFTQRATSAHPQSSVKVSL